MLVRSRHDVARRPNPHAVERLECVSSRDSRCLRPGVGLDGVDEKPAPARLGGEVQTEKCEESIGLSITFHTPGGRAGPHVDSHSAQKARYRGRAGQGRCEGHFEISFERRVDCPLADPAEEGFCRVVERNLDPVGGHHGAPNGDLGSFLREGTRPVEDATKRDAGGLAGGKALPENRDTITRLHFSWREIGHANELEGARRVPTPPDGKPDEHQGERDDRNAAKDLHE